MFWPLVLPIQWTAAILFGLGLLAVATAPLLKRKRTATFWWVLLVVALAFIPSCTGIMTVLDSVRFGTFQYATFGDVDDVRVERYLPPAATDIRVRKHMQGFDAKFRISESALDRYLESLWDEYGDGSTFSRAEYQESKQRISRSHPFLDDPKEWPPLTNPVEFQSPTAPNGAGFTIWYSKEDGVAYERASYW
ncbi:hypothetical protein [Aeoliella sp. SH292]|uniref:hypothetical protein n=1 Tax=Aeoliella sp. SH292 TaxID=3454464 RepID=UPI003F971AF6